MKITCLNCFHLNWKEYVNHRMQHFLYCILSGGVAIMNALNEREQRYVCVFSTLFHYPNVSLVFTFSWEMFLLNMMFKCCQVGNVTIIHHVPRQGFFIIKILCHIGYMCMYVFMCACVSDSAICGRRMSLFLLYAFRVFIIFSRLLINCNADHNNSIHKYGWEYASRFFTPRCV